MIDIRLPNITGSTEREQLQQIKSYLHQTVEQLNWALNNIDTTINTAVVTPTARSLAPAPSGSVSQSDPQATFASIKSLIIKSAEIVDAYYEEIDKKLVGLYYADSDFGSFFEATQAEIKANSTGITQTYTSIQTLESAVGGIDTTVQTLGETVTLLDGTVTDLDTTVQTVDGKVDTVDGKVDTVAAEASTNLKEAKDGILENVTALVGVVDANEKAIQDVKDGAEKSIKAVQDSVDGLSGNIDDVKDNVDKKAAELEKAIADTNSEVRKVTGIIKSGVIGKDNDENDVIGIMIGQTNTVNDVVTYSAYASFTSNRLSFYNASGYEVAYISDNKLYITHAEITSSFKLGGFVDTVMSDGRVVTKWLGGN